jgi:DNA-directed RNA polymerase specialized sigma24 family protein
MGLPRGNTLCSRWVRDDTPGRSPTATFQPAPEQDDALLAAAFRELHGARLHGFAILVTLGDRRAAERAAGFALAAGAEQAAALRHPERAAAWLRARTLRTLGPRLRRSTPAEARRAALEALGVEEAVHRGLAALNVNARAAFVASAIEGFDPIDVETILDAGPAATRRTVAEARDRYLRNATRISEDEAAATLDRRTGELARRVQSVAARAFSTSDATR